MNTLTIQKVTLLSWYTSIEKIQPPKSYNACPIILGNDIQRITPFFHILHGD